MNALPGLPEPLYPMSAAKLDTWLACPRQYFWKHVEPARVPARRFAVTMIGNAVHLALRTWWADQPARHEDTIIAMERMWEASLFRDQTQSMRAFDRVRMWVLAYLDKQPNRDDPDHQVRGVERTISTTTEHLTLAGRVDRIDLRHGEVVVVDYKTGRNPSTDDEARTSMALAIYADSIRRTLRQDARQVELHHVPSGTIGIHVHTEASLGRHLARADQIGVEVRDAVRAHAGDGDLETHFPARANGLCGWCPYWSICSTGQSHSTQRESWAGVDEADHASSSGEAFGPV